MSQEFYDSLFSKPTENDPLALIKALGRAGRLRRAAREMAMEEHLLMPEMVEEEEEMLVRLAASDGARIWRGGAWWVEASLVPDGVELSLQDGPPATLLLPDATISLLPLRPVFYSGEIPSQITLLDADGVAWTLEES